MNDVGARSVVAESVSAVTYRTRGNSSAAGAPVRLADAGPTSATHRTGRIGLAVFVLADAAVVVPLCLQSVVWGVGVDDQPRPVGAWSAAGIETVVDVEGLKLAHNGTLLAKTTDRTCVAAGSCVLSSSSSLAHEAQLFARRTALYVIVAFSIRRKQHRDSVSAYFCPYSALCPCLILLASLSPQLYT